MRKIFILSITLITLPFFLVAQAPKSEGVTTSYSLLSINYDTAYFLAAKESSDSYSLNLKLPLTDLFGVELGYGSFTKNITSYSIGTNRYTGKGKEIYSKISIDFVFYFWFMPELQLELGLNHYKFDSGWILVNPSASTSGNFIDLAPNWKSNNIAATAGISLDVQMYKEFFIATKLKYIYFLNTDDITKNGAVSFGLGLGYKL